MLEATPKVTIVGTANCKIRRFVVAFVRKLSIAFF